jgi:hypothetical protein
LGSFTDEEIKHLINLACDQKRRILATPLVNIKSFNEMKKKEDEDDDEDEDLDSIYANI